MLIDDYPNFYSCWLPDLGGQVFCRLTPDCSRKPVLGKAVSSSCICTCTTYDVGVLCGLAEGGSAEGRHNKQAGLPRAT